MCGEVLCSPFSWSCVEAWKGHKESTHMEHGWSTYLVYNSPAFCFQVPGWFIYVTMKNHCLKYRNLSRNRDWNLTILPPGVWQTAELQRQDPSYYILLLALWSLIPFHAWSLIPFHCFNRRVTLSDKRDILQPGDWAFSLGKVEVTPVKLRRSVNPLDNYIKEGHLNSLQKRMNPAQLFQTRDISIYPQPIQTVNSQWSEAPPLALTQV